MNKGIVQKNEGIKKIIEKSLKVGGGVIVGGVLKTPLRYHRRGWVGSKIQILPKFMFQISECMCFGAILISAGGIGLRGAVQKNVTNCRRCP